MLCKTGYVHNTLLPNGGLEAPVTPLSYATGNSEGHVANWIVKNKCQYRSFNIINVHLKYIYEKLNILWMLRFWSSRLVVLAIWFSVCGYYLVSTVPNMFWWHISIELASNTASRYACGIRAYHQVPFNSLSSQNSFFTPVPGILRLLKSFFSQNVSLTFVNGPSCACMFRAYILITTQRWLWSHAVWHYRIIKYLFAKFQSCTFLSSWGIFFFDVLHSATASVKG